MKTGSDFLPDICIFIILETMNRLCRSTIIFVLFVEKIIPTENSSYWGMFHQQKPFFLSSGLFWSHLTSAIEVQIFYISLVNATSFIWQLVFNWFCQSSFDRLDEECACFLMRISFTENYRCLLEDTRVFWTFSSGKRHLQQQKHTKA